MNSKKLSITIYTTFCVYCRIFIDEGNEEELRNSYHLTCHEEFTRFNKEHEEKLKNMTKKEKISELNGPNIAELRIQMLKELRCPRIIFVDTLEDK